MVSRTTGANMFFFNFFSDLAALLASGEVAGTEERSEEGVECLPGVARGDEGRSFSGGRWAVELRTGDRARLEGVLLAKLP
jgi:hypothetical protein